MENKRKVALYVRVSKDEHYKDNRYQSLENQLQPLREFVKNNNWKIYKEYKDKWSGADPNRTAFKEMMLHAYQKKFDIIIVWKLDRFSRENMNIVLSYIIKLRSYDVAIMSLTESWFDTRKDNPMTDLVLAIMSWVASEERRKISERTKAGIRRRKAINIWKGGRPKGVKDKKKRIRRFWKKNDIKTI